jgi:hypothetical protein
MTIGIAGTEIDLEDQTVEEPDWEELKALLEQTESWILGGGNDEYGALHLEPLALLYNMFFVDFESEDDRLREMIFRVENMAIWSSSEDKKLDERLARLIEPRPAVLH